MTTLWADDLSTEYQHGRTLVSKHLRTLDKENIHDAQQASFCNSMIRNSKEVEEWLSTGRDPKSYGGIDKRSIYHRNSFDTLEGMDLIPDIRDRLNQPHKDLSMTSEMEKTLADILLTLSARERQCYILQKTQGMTAVQIGEELGIGHWSVYEYLKRADKKINKKV